MRKYVVAYITRRSRTDWPHAMTVEADNAKDARSEFDRMYWFGQYSTNKKPHPFHITVRRMDNLSECPLCGNALIEQGEYVVCPHYPCGLKIKRDRM